MNLIQVLPELSVYNMRFTDIAHDYGQSFEVIAIYDAGGPRFKVSERRNASDVPRGRLGKYARADLCNEMRRACMNGIRQAMAEHLAVINPVDND